MGMVVKVAETVIFIAEAGIAAVVVGGMLKHLIVVTKRRIIEWQRRK